MTAPNLSREIATIRAEAASASPRLCLRELRFWRHHRLPIDPIADAALAAYRARLDHIHRMDMAVALTRLQLADREPRP